MAKHRCDLCGAPLQRPGKTEFCSERCLAWSFFGVPALREEELIREIRKNQTTDELPSDWERPMPYPGFGKKFQGVIVDALAELRQTCNQIRKDR